MFSATLIVFRLGVELLNVILGVGEAVSEAAGVGGFGERVDGGEFREISSRILGRLPRRQQTRQEFKLAKLGLDSNKAQLVSSILEPVGDEFLSVVHGNADFEHNGKGLTVYK